MEVRAYPLDAVIPYGLEFGVRVDTPDGNDHVRLYRIIRLNEDTRIVTGRYTGRTLPSDGRNTR